MKLRSSRVNFKGKIMPRIRTIKPEFFVDEDIGSLPPLTRLIFEGLWCHADKAGRLEYRPEYLKVQIIPYDTTEDIRLHIDVLSTPKKRTGIPFVLKYEVDGITYLQVVNWSRHQYVHKTNESESTNPPPPESELEKYHNGKTTIVQRLSNGMTTAYEGRERKGRYSVALSPSDDSLKPIIYLNKKAGTHFEPTNPQWNSMVSARLREGHTLEDFQKVIDFKTSEWKQDPKMYKYLRPSTLFTSNHMEEYLNEAKRTRR
jgi:uncharacterized phage protein (TIGR02220 family)